MIISVQLPLSGITLATETTTGDVDVMAEVGEHIVIAEALLSGPVGAALLEALVSPIWHSEKVACLNKVDKRLAYDIVEVEREESMKRMAQ